MVLVRICITSLCTTTVPSPSLPTHSPVPPEVPLEVQPVLVHQSVFVVKFLEDAFVVVQALRNPGPQGELSSAQTFILDKPDFLLPLREEATSRFIMRQHLHHDFALSRAGFFSLQVFRFIHFNSRAFEQCPDDYRQVEFSSAQEYDEYLANLRNHFPHKTDSFFCDPRAFGQCIKERTASRFTDYWIVSQSADYKWPPSRVFSEAWKEMKTFKKNSNKSGNSVWKGMGELSLYMLIADLHYADIVDAPTPQDVACAVSAIRKGGFFGLEKLGYVTERASKTAIEKAFVQFYEDITERLSEEQRARFKWDSIVAEHTLCKFSRAHRAGHYQL
ncbi:hypothetical protein BDY19DRAFT_997882 [Irpex rosettiformis]|uniref:Uncharacterized protein n=1 Tax=Irpex rosettiformis TaxID=378272 RepID=A0ACB8TQ11_9APHY|nr:hypothetical protein BDY19DRAFT_997882 [Irpex rosettiformis]